MYLSDAELQGRIREIAAQAEACSDGTVRYEEMIALRAANHDYTLVRQGAEYLAAIEDNTFAILRQIGDIVLDDPVHHLVGNQVTLGDEGVDLFA